MISGCINEFPQVVALQSEYCDPFYKAVEAKSNEPAKVEVKPTIAEGIAIGVPMRGEVITAPEDKILEARAELAAKGIYCEHTTAASYAAYKKYCDIYGRTEDTLISMCGAGLKSDH